MKRGGRRKGSGRPKGALNKLSLDTKENIIFFLETNWKRFVDETFDLSREDFVKVYLVLLEYAVPKLSRTELSPPQDDSSGVKKITVEFNENPSDKRIKENPTS